MLRLETDLLDVLMAACDGNLAGVQLQWSPDTALTVVMAAKGYPGSYQKGSVIRNLYKVSTAKVSAYVFSAALLCLLIKQLQPFCLCKISVSRFVLICQPEQLHELHMCSTPWSHVVCMLHTLSPPKVA